jgi:peptidyl-prolyl cis-trans isomerase D
MLQAIRERLVGWVLWVIIGAICVPFAFWGVESFRTGGGDPVVAKVGSEKITESQLSAALEQRFRQMQALMGDSFRADQFDRKRFRGIVLEDLVQESVLRQYGDKAGYATPDSLLFETVQSIPVFQDNGKFSTARYRERLAQEGYTPARFERQVRESIGLEQIRSGLIETAFVTDADLAANYRLSAQQRGLSYVQFDAARYLAAVTVADQQIKDRYDEKMSLYMAPERIKLAYVELDLEKLPKAGDPGLEVLKATYEAEKATRFSTPEERQARHILIGFGADKDNARKQAEAIAAKIKGGADFAQLAKAESTDTGSKKDGGSLGWVRRGQMVAKFEEALFALRKGEVSAPVETEFGWHLIKLDDLRPAAVRSFEDKAVQAELLELYQKRELEKHFQDEQEKLEQLAFENPAGLEPVAKALNLEIKTTDWFGRNGGAGLAADPAVIQAAFSEEIVKGGENSKPLSAGEGRVVVVRKAEYEAPRQKPLPEVTEQIRTELKEDAAIARAKSEAAALLAAVQGGQTLEDAAKKAGVELKKPGLIKRNASDVNSRIVSTLFKMPRPDGSTARYEQVTLAKGDVAVIALNEVKDAELTAAGDESQALRKSLRDTNAGLEFGAFRAQLRSETDVKVLRPEASETEEPAP